MSVDFLLYHAGYIGVALLLSLSLSYVWRANLFSFGHYAFFAIGAYAAAALSQTFTTPDTGWFLASPAHRGLGFVWLIVTVLAGAVVAGGFAAIVGRIFAGARGDYFAVVTLILSELVISLISNWPFVGGAIGVDVPYLIFSNTGTEHLYYVLFYTLFALSLAGALLWACRRIDNSVVGVWLDAIRDDELASAFSGIAVQNVQLMIFIFAAAIAGAAGALFLQMTTFVAPTDFAFINSIPVILYVVLGRGRPIQCVFVTIVLYAAYELIKLRFLGLLGDDVGEFVNDWRDSIMGAVLILSAAIPVLLRRYQTSKA